MEKSNMFILLDLEIIMQEFLRIVLKINLELLRNIVLKIKSTPLEFTHLQEWCWEDVKELIIYIKDGLVILKK